MSDPKSTPELLSGIAAEWDLLQAAIARLTPKQMVTPDAGGWSPKDNLAHLSQWMKALLGFHIDRQPAEQVLGIPKDLADNFDFQRVNEYMFEHNRDRSVEDVLAELNEMYARVVARLEVIPFSELLLPRWEDDPEKTPLLAYVLGNTTGHFAEHRATIEKILQ
jgi:hypothetical protein